MSLIESSNNLRSDAICQKDTTGFSKWINEFRATNVCKHILEGENELKLGTYATMQPKTTRIAKRYI